MKRVLLACLLFASLAAARTYSLVGTVGPTSKIGDWDPSVAWNVHLLWNIDQMVMLGPGVGYEGESHSYMPVTGKLMVRLPIGRQALPYLDGELGAGVRDVLSESFLAWKCGAGVDQKLGDRSSILLGSGFQNHHRYYIRAGLLVEF